MTAVLGWVFAVLVLAAFAVSVERRQPNIFAWANVILCVPLAVTEVLVGASFAAVMSMAFGIVSAAGLHNQHCPRGVAHHG